MLNSPVVPPPDRERLPEPKPVIVKLPDVSAIEIADKKRIVLPVRLLSNVMVSSPGAAAARATAFRSEPAPVSAVLITTIEGGCGWITVMVPLVVVILLVPWVKTVLALVRLPEIVLAEISVRLPVRVRFAVRLILPVELLPIVNIPAVMLFNSP